MAMLDNQMVIYIYIYANIGKIDGFLTHMLHGAGIFTCPFAPKITQFCR